MTLKEASEIFYINAEIRTLRDKLREMEEERTFYKPMTLSTTKTDQKNQKRYTNPSDKYLSERFETERELYNSLGKLEAKIAEFEAFLHGVDDAEMRLILRLRCVNNLSWSKIGREVYMDRRTVSRKFHDFFRKSAHNVT